MRISFIALRFTIFDAILSFLIAGREDEGEEASFGPASSVIDRKLGEDSSSEGRETLPLVKKVEERRVDIDFVTVIRQPVTMNIVEEAFDSLGVHHVLVD